ncbi:MAG TPA: glycosyltransferase family 4 protein [Terriglobia bacterium]|nr:glycosyltransferase family 4 protein [Terriglobia bacterium]
MKIAVWYNLPSGGGKRALYNYVRGLAERGHAIESWCPSTADRSYLPLSDLVPEHVLPLPWTPEGRRNFLLSRAYGATRDRLRRMDRHCRECAEEINCGGFDLLFANPCMFFSSGAIARYIRIPSVLYLQDPFRQLYEALPKLRWVALDTPRGWWRSPNFLARRFADFLKIEGMRVQAREELRNAQAFSSILVNSYYSRESVLRAYGLDSKVCYLGVDTNLFVNQGRPREFFVVGIGSFTPGKGIDFAIRAVGQLQPPRPRLIWIGNASERGYLEFLTRLSQSQGVEFEPKLMIQDSEMADILNRASIMVYAPRLEPFGLAALEGNACGLPVVAVAEGGVRETVVDGVNGLLVEHDPQRMAAAIQYLIDRPDCAAQLGANGRRMVLERWTVQHSVERLEQRFIELMQRGNASQ